MSRRRIALATAVACIALLCGCGSSSRPIDPAVQSHLRQDVSTLASDVAAHRLQQAQADWNSLNAELAAARTAGKISSGKFDEIHAAMDAVFGDLQGPAATTTPPAAPSSPSPSPSDKHGKGKDKSSSSSSSGGDNGNGDGG